MGERLLKETARKLFQNVKSKTFPQIQLFSPSVAEAGEEAGCLELRPSVSTGPS